MGKRRNNKRSSHRRGGFAGYQKSKPASKHPNLSIDTTKTKKRRHHVHQVSTEQMDSVAIEIFGPDRTYHGNLSSN